ncbi:hypothetical protein ACXWR7_13855, partial [Streptococcus pyogenes]
PPFSFPSPLLSSFSSLPSFSLFLLLSFSSPPFPSLPPFSFPFSPFLLSLFFSFSLPSLPFFPLLLFFFLFSSFSLS